MIEALKKEVNSIVIDRKRSDWCNGWVWDKNSSRDIDRFQQRYYFLIEDIENEFSYKDLDDFSITIRQADTTRYLNSESEYRIDIRDRYGVHNFWYFDKHSFHLVSGYVKDIINNQYNSIMKKYCLIGISKDQASLKSHYRQIKLDGILSNIDMSKSVIFSSEKL